MLLICPECKNEVNLASYPNLDVNHVVECDVCGITLQIKTINNGNIEAEVMDEGK